jgi:hypothetical protein
MLTAGCFPAQTSVRNRPPQTRRKPTVSEAVGDEGEHDDKQHR